MHMSTERKTRFANASVISAQSSSSSFFIIIKQELVCETARKTRSRSRSAFYSWENQIAPRTVVMAEKTTVSRDEEELIKKRLLTQTTTARPGADPPVKKLGKK